MKPSFFRNLARNNSVLVAHFFNRYAALLDCDLAAPLRTELPRLNEKLFAEFQLAHEDQVRALDKRLELIRVESEQKEWLGNVYRDASQNLEGSYQGFLRVILDLPLPQAGVSASQRYVKLFLQHGPAVQEVLQGKPNWKQRLIRWIGKQEKRDGEQTVDFLSLGDNAEDFASLNAAAAREQVEKLLLLPLALAAIKQRDREKKTFTQIQNAALDRGLIMRKQGAFDHQPSLIRDLLMVHFREAYLWEIGRRLDDDTEEEEPLASASSDPQSITLRLPSIIRKGMLNEKEQFTRLDKRQTALFADLAMEAGVFLNDFSLVSQKDMSFALQVLTGFQGKRINQTFTAVRNDLKPTDVSEVKRALKEMLRNIEEREKKMGEF